MPTITKSIGTSSRDYSTVALWEADLDNGAVYAAGDAAVGECYNDSVFSENPTLNGGSTVGLASVTLQGAAGQRHSGVAATGARIHGNIIFNSGSTTIAWRLKWLEQKGGSSIGIQFQFGGGGAPVGEVWNCIAWNCNSNSSGGSQIRFQNFCTGKCINTIVYNMTNSDGAFGTRDAIGIVCSTSGANDEVYNCTVYNVRNLDVSAGQNAYGIGITTGIGAVKNCLVVSTSSVAGTAADYGGGTLTTCLSSDATGTAGLTNKTAANQFVSTVSGSEDLHLKAGADAIDAGTDLVTTPTGVNIDIDGRDRDAEGDVWDVGADEFVASGNRRRRVLCGAIAA
jgi:hypothetical protein